MGLIWASVLCPPIIHLMLSSLHRKTDDASFYWMSSVCSSYWILVFIKVLVKLNPFVAGCLDISCRDSWGKKQSLVSVDSCRDGKYWVGSV